ncbi:Asp23/Gls24 family envelope stress response protein [Amycolatopsis jiangsuensis]|uniref:Putative alkaline shock family protein YloU n=1 Tax=Amycolatopsis jiangsuensis TaxID=1181879 RepID=A0A840IX99_9PSEU|nr:Asp23/Gls24 family envelope stress response protein [Amycolatopsis jiangsuensis]MBB4687441.1 putative alkaline shock family protein YloU [Amycolatopsis jiangsuensis]
MTATQSETAELATRPDAGPLVTSQGVTTVADVVVQKIAGLATREVTGVHALGGGAARALGALRDRIPGASASAGQGVAVEVGEKQAAIDLQIVVEYGVPIAELARQVRRNVIGAIEQMTGLEVVEVNITVGDVYLPSDEEPQATDRVQ